MTETTGSPKSRSTAFWYWRMVWAMLRLKQLKLDEPRHVAKPVKGWSAESLYALIEESRREHDSQKSSLDRILSRSQFLFTTDLALLAFYGTVASAVWVDSSLAWAVCLQRVLIVAAGLVLVLSLLGSASLIASRKPFEGVSAVVMSKWEMFDLEHLANDYTGSLATGDMTNNVHLSVFGSVVRMTLLAALLGGLGWVVAQFF